ncbi:hypothetical protein BHE74_00025724 [Ensete ventricosum]|nr:hypothetical protein BHE74_00025724 [Ensete ventricosum]
MLGTCMVIGDGILTPAISGDFVNTLCYCNQGSHANVIFSSPVFSAVSGLELSMSKEHHEYAVVPITCFILVCLFALQHYGTHRVGILFAPVVLTWLLCISGLGIYNIVHWNPHVYQALSPYYMFKFLKKTKKGGWMSLGGILLCITEAMFADLGHFSYTAIQIYIPEINWMLMILCIAVTVGFRDIKHMGNASGLAVITVMLVTTCLTSLVMILCWRKSPFLALAFLLFFGSIEVLYFSASLIKFLEGAWLPILLALFLMIVMFVWHYATIKKYEFDLHNKVSLDWLLALGDKLGIVRVPGIGLVFTDIVSGVPANFSRFVTNLPAFHRILVFVCVKSVPVPFVPPSERYLVGRVGPPYHRSYRCIVRYGYRDVHQDVDSFESELIASLADFIQLEASFSGQRSSELMDGYEDGLTVIGRSVPTCRRDYNTVSSTPQGTMAGELASEENAIELAPSSAGKKVRFFREENNHPALSEPAREELNDLLAARESGCAFVLGHSHVQASPGSSIMKKLAIDVAYNFLRRNCRGPDVALRVPPASLLEVGMVYVL